MVLFHQKVSAQNRNVRFHLDKPRKRTMGASSVTMPHTGYSKLVHTTQGIVSHCFTLNILRTLNLPFSRQHMDNVPLILTSGQRNLHCSCSVRAVIARSQHRTDCSATGLLTTHACDCARATILATMRARRIIPAKNCARQHDVGEPFDAICEAK